MNGKAIRFGFVDFTAPVLAALTRRSDPNHRAAPAGHTPQAGGPRPSAPSKPSPPAAATGPRKTLRAVNFICRAPQAKSVSLVGDFNQWEPASHPMRQMPDRAWLLQVELPHGHHRYAFLVDGRLELDPQAQGIARNDQGQRVSVVPVS